MSSLNEARWLALHLPRLATDARIRAGRAPSDQPFALYAKEANAFVLTGVNVCAQKLGLRAGMALADARAIYPALVVAEADAREQTQALDAIAAWCERFTPVVVLDAPDGLFLDVTGCAHLFGGEAELQDLLRRKLETQGFTNRAAIAPTPGCAWALARYAPPLPRGEEEGGEGRPGSSAQTANAPVRSSISAPHPDRPSPPTPPSARERGSLARLPVQALRLEEASAALLKRLGIKTIGQLAQAPRASFAARAGEHGRYPWGSFELDACKQVNLLDLSGKREHPQWYWAEQCDDHYPAAAPVGSFPPNAWGLHDMIGNVWEWVADCWHADYSGAPANGTAWSGDNCRKHVNRGGGWGNNVRAMRLSSRDGDPTAATSDGLGLRVVRSLGATELPQPTPDTPPPILVAQTPVAAHGSSGKAAVAAAPVPIGAPAPPVFATSLATERAFEVHVTVNGTQTWRNALQHTQGSTTQDYLLSTRLRSDGVLYGDNLLDPDQSTRLAVKQQFLARRGLIQLQALNGGHLPHTAEELAAFTARVQASLPDCVGDERCGGAVAERAAALDALRDNPVQDLEALIAAPANGETPRWLYFFGYAGCPVRIHLRNETHIAGERAYDHAHKTLVPWSLDRSADSEGGAEDRGSLCQLYTATVDTLSGDVYLENLYLPSAPGTTVRTIHRNTEHRDEPLPVPSEVLAWTSAQLSRTHETLNASATLVPHVPLDGDYTVLGDFDGKLEVNLSWSFKPVDGAPLAAVPR